MTFIQRALVALLFAASLLGAGACKYLGIHTRGDAAPVSRPISGFDAVDIAGDLTADITVGQPFALALDGPRDLAGKVQTRVQDGTLFVALAQPAGGAARPHLRVALPSLRRLQVTAAEAQVTGAAAPRLTIAAHGGSSVKVSAIQGDRLMLEATEGSRVVLAGSARSLDFTLSGNSRGDARELTLRTARVRLAGGCRLDLRPTQAVTGEATGSSRLAVWSTPKRVKVATRGDSVVNYVR